MHIENIYVRRSEFRQGRLNRYMQRLGTISSVCALLLDIVPATLVVRSVLKTGRERSRFQYTMQTHFRRHHNLIAYPPGFHPLSDEHLRALVLVVVGCVDEVSPGFIERVK